MRASCGGNAGSRQVRFGTQTWSLHLCRNPGQTLGGSARGIEVALSQLALHEQGQQYSFAEPVSDKLPKRPIDRRGGESGFTVCEVESRQRSAHLDAVRVWTQQGGRLLQAPLDNAQIGELSGSGKTQNRAVRGGWSESIEQGYLRFVPPSDAAEQGAVRHAALC